MVGCQPRQSVVPTAPSPPPHGTNNKHRKIIRRTVISFISTVPHGVVAVDLEDKDVQRLLRITRIPLDLYRFLEAVDVGDVRLDAEGDGHGELRGVFCGRHELSPECVWKGRRWLNVVVTVVARAFKTALTNQLDNPWKDLTAFRRFQHLPNGGDS